MNEIIPIKNIYYMILYAFNKVKNKTLSSTLSSEADISASELLVELFLAEVKYILKRGVYKNYNEIEEDSLYIKGKIDISKSFKSISVKKKIIHDDFNPNNNANTILKFTLSNLLFSNISMVLKRKIKSIYPYFQDIDYKNIDDNDYKYIVLNKSNLHYDFAIQLSIFINKKVIPKDKLGNRTFVDIIQDDETMSMIYEEFLRNFYKIHTNYKVASKEYSWYLEPLENSNINMLPKMKTDIEITINKSSKIIIDAKYYHDALKSRFDKDKFNSSNLYQLNTYLEHNLEFKNLRGILLYPCVNYYFNEKYYRKDLYTIELVTVDLNRDWSEISNSLLNVIL